MAERAKSHTVEVDASHAVTVSQPGVVARVIVEAARDGRLTGRRPPTGPATSSRRQRGGAGLIDPEPGCRRST
jgi:FAD/FMN-containing dehydrogenase